MRRLLLALASLFCMFRVSYVLGCSCGPVAPACAYVNGATAVFIGKVAFTNHDESLGFVQQTLVRFEVEEAFKGLATGANDVWIDPGSFTSCYAPYSVGQRMLVFAYGGRIVPPDAPMMSVVARSTPLKPIPPGWNQNNPPMLYIAAECSGTRELEAESARMDASEIEYLRRYRAGTSVPMATGRVMEENLGFDFDDHPLAGVTITLGHNGRQLKTTTNSEGVYSFENLAIGRYSVAASLPHYVSQGKPQRSIDVFSKGCANEDFEMAGTGVIEGQVVDHAGQPLANVEVSLIRSGSRDKSWLDGIHVESGRNGRYRFESLPAGDFEVGINLFEAPRIENPYAPTKWFDNGRSAIRLLPGDHKRVGPLQLPLPARTRRIRVEVLWPDGRPVDNATVDANIGPNTSESGETSPNGTVELAILEGFQYIVRAQIWVGPEDKREVAKSIAVEVPNSLSVAPLRLILDQSSKYWE